MCGYKFKNYGSNHNNYHTLPYITVACALGVKKEEIDSFVNKFLESVKELKK